MCTFYFLKRDKNAFISNKVAEHTLDWPHLSDFACFLEDMHINKQFQAFATLILGQNLNFSYHIIQIVHTKFAKQFKLKFKLNNLQHSGCFNQFMINIPYFIVNI